MFISLAHLNHSENTLHRYQDIEKHYTTLVSFDNCRMIKNSVLRINTTIDTIISSNFGYYTYSDNAEGKKYYFYILDYQYVNDTVVEIFISIDWFYTDFVELKFQKSLIERIHPKNFDDDFTNTNENVSIGEQIKDLHRVFTPSNSFKYVVGVTHKIPPIEIDLWDVAKIGYVVNAFPPFETDLTSIMGSPSNCVYYVLDTLEECMYVWHNAVTAGISDSVKYFNLVSDNLINTTQEKTYSDNIGDEFTVKILNSTRTLLQASADGSSLFNITKPHILDSYTPVYKKVLSSQFYNIILQTSNTCKTYNPEMFDGDTCNFTIYYTNSPDCKLYITPCNYAGVDFSDFTDNTSLNGSINGMLTTSTFDSLISSTITGDIASLISRVPSIVGGVIQSFKEREVPVTAILNEMKGENKKLDLWDVANQGIQGVFNDASQIYASPLRGGMASVGSTNTTISNLVLPDQSNAVYLGYSSPRRDDLQRIDRYFSMFGYNISDTITPYFRDSYTFIKGDVNFYGATNNLSVNYIKTLFRNGLTVWNSYPLYTYDVSGD